MEVLNDEISNVTAQITSFNSDVVDLSRISGYAIRHAVTDATTSADTFTDTDVTIAADTITLTAHGLTTGALGRLTSTGTLPAGLSLATDYFVIVVDANTVELATSLANALAGTQVDITDAGTVSATNTFTPTALAGAVTFQASVDKINWETLASPASNAFTGSESTLVVLADTYYAYVRVAVSVTAGACNFVAHISGL